ERFSVHGSGALVRCVSSCPDPFKIAYGIARDSRMDICQLRRKRRSASNTIDWLRKIVGRNGPQCLINVGQMLAVKLVEVAIVGRMMLGTIPPVPITAFPNQKLFECKLALFLRGLGRMLAVKVARVVEVIPGAIVFRRANPDIEVGID